MRVPPAPQLPNSSGDSEQERTLALGCAHAVNGIQLLNLYSVRPLTHVRNTALVWYRSSGPVHNCGEIPRSAECMARNRQLHDHRSCQYLTSTYMLYILVACVGCAVVVRCKAAGMFSRYLSWRILCDTLIPIIAYLHIDLQTINMFTFCMR